MWITYASFFWCSRYTYNSFLASEIFLYPLFLSLIIMLIELLNEYLASLKPFPYCDYVPFDSLCLLFSWSLVLTDQKLTCQVHEIVGRINGRFGTLTAVPIHHLVCLLTPIKMNPFILSLFVNMQIIPVHNWNSAQLRSFLYWFSSGVL